MPGAANVKIKWTRAGGGGTAPVVTSPAFLVTGTVGTLYPTTPFTASGTSPITWSITSGTLPAGMAFSSAGVLSGTPTATASGSITFTATNAYGSASTSLTLTVNAPSGVAPAISEPATLSRGAVGILFPTTTFNATGTAPITWSITSGTLPAGMSFTSAGVLSGTPASAADTTITFTASNSGGSASRPLTLTVKAAGVVTISDPVTYAINATGSGTRYDVNSDTDMDNVPWGALGAGDVVNIFWKASPYTRKWGMGRNLDRVGTQTNPIVINGVTDASGNRPQFDWQQCTTAKGSNPSLLTAWVAANPGVTPSTKYDCFPSGSNENLAGIFIFAGNNTKPAFFQIKNLEVYGTRGTFTNLAGSSVAWSDNGDSTTGIRFNSGKDGLVENCLISNAGWGVFSSINGDNQGYTFERLTLRNNRIFDCGTYGNYSYHGCYIQCVNPVIEGNYFGKCRSGSSYKSRTSGEIFRYNWVEATGRCLDFVEPQDQVLDAGATTGSSFIVGQSDYGVDHVYGNVFVVDDGLLQGDIFRPFHFGNDTWGEQETLPYTGGSVGTAPLYVGPTINGKKLNRQKLYFYNNTVILNTQYVINFFQISESTATIEMWNNLFWASSGGGTRFGAGLFNMIDLGGNVKYRGGNVRYAASTPTPAASWAHCFTSTSGFYYVDPTKTTEQIIQPLVSTNPVLTDIASFDYSVSASGSAAGIGLTSFPASLDADFKSLTVQYQPTKRNNGLVSRASLSKSGALE